MVMPITERRWTAQMVRELPDDGNRYEVVDGVLLVTPAPRGRHQAVLMQFIGRLWEYLKPLGRTGCLFTSPADISWAADVLVQPDLFVLAPEDVSDDWATAKHLQLVIEILSPSTRRADRVTKRAAYQRYGVGTCWIVDADAANVEVWHPGDASPAEVRDVLRWQVSPGSPVLEIGLPELFGSLPR